MCGTLTIEHKEMDFFLAENKDFIESEFVSKEHRKVRPSINTNMTQLFLRREGRSPEKVDNPLYCFQILHIFSYYLYNNNNNNNNKTTRHDEAWL